MEIIRKDTPVGLDLVIDEIQTLIYNYLTNDSCVKGNYTDYASYSRVYKNVYQGKNKTGVFAEQFLTGNDYQSVFTNDNISVSSFIIANDSEKRHTKTRKIRTISVIFQINLKKVYADIPHRADEEFHNELSNALRGLKKPHVLIDGINGIDNVYTEFEIARLKEKNHDLQPLHVFRQDIEVQYDYDCCPVFATSGTPCGLSVTGVSITNETVVDANDGTATANHTGEQVTGEVSYLWNDPLAQTTKTATLLAPNTYTVTVTDLNLPLCSDSGNGTVDAAIATDNTLTLDQNNDHLLFGSAIDIPLSGAYTLQWEVNHNNLGASAEMIFTDTDNPMFIATFGDSAVRMKLSAALKTFAIPTILDDEWNIFHLVRSGSSNRLYKNGVESTTGAITDSAPFTINSISKYSAGGFFLGANIDNIGVAEGIAATATNLTNMVADATIFASEMSAATSGIFLNMNQSGSDTVALDTFGTSNNATLTDFSPSPPAASPWNLRV